MSDKSKELTLRVHDECGSPPSDLRRVDQISIRQVTDLMSLDPTFVHASPTSSSPLRSVSAALSAAVSVSLFTSARKVELLEKSLSKLSIYEATVI